MQTTIDEVTKKKIKLDSRTYIVLVREGVLGFTREIDKCIRVFSRNSIYSNDFSYTKLWDGISGIEVRAIYEEIKGKIFFSNKHGVYMFKDEWSPENIIIETYTKYPVGGNSGYRFPYKFNRTYEAINHFDLFKGKQEILDKNKDVKSALESQMDYTFGLEFETSAGMIPERICLRDGLIPLRDGSISGFEYSTVVMNPKNQGIQLLKQQLDTLKNFTIFNKECSLHIHFGNYPMNPNKIYALYRMCYNLQPEISNLVPALTFQSGRYKSSGKDYCKSLPYFESFKDMYYSLVGKPYLGSLEYPHPNDPNRNRKWNIPTRYFYVNFINILCYKVNKTIEFRLLRPTFNYKKIKVWMYIFNAIMKFSDNHSEDIEKGRFDGADLGYIIRDVYSSDLANSVVLEMNKLRILREMQETNGDKIGQDLMIEDQLFN